MNLSREQLLTADKRYRATLINSLAGFRQVSLVGTISKQGQTNLAVFNSLIHLGADPPLYGMISRPDSAERHTLENIRANGSWTVNFMDEKYRQQVHQTSARYPREVSEFDACGFTHLFREGVPAPFVKESPVQISLELQEEVRITQNNTVLLIGKVHSIFLPEGFPSEDGFVDLQHLQLLLCSGLDSYHTATQAVRLPYAKANGST